MSKNILSTILVTLFIASVAIAQEGSVKIHSVQLVDENFNMSNAIKLTTPPTVLSGENVITTRYDYFSNTIIRDQIVFDVTNQRPHLFNMIEPFPGGNLPESRHVVHSRRVGTNWISQSVSTGIGSGTGVGRGGWPHIDIGLTGDLAGTVAMVWHTPNRLSIWDGGTGYLTSQFDPNTDPSVQLTGNKIFLATSGNRAIYKFYRSTDFGVTFTYWDSIRSFVPPLRWVANGSVEVGMSKSPNEQHIVIFGGAAGRTGGGAHINTGSHPDSADNLWHIRSTNQGTNWSAATIARDGQINAVQGYHTPNFAPLFQNFAQLDMVVTNTGVRHAVTNGYGLVFNTAGPIDTVVRGSQFPLLYWNSNTNQWRSISSRAIDTLSRIVNTFPTNAIGQSYPSIAASEDGQVIYVIWTGPQLTATGGLDTASNGAATPVQYYWRDLYHAVSTNAGTTWNYLGKFPGMSPTLSETYGTVAQHLERVNPTTLRAHIVYLADRTTGVGPFDQVLTDNPIVYATYDIFTLSADNSQIANNFELWQNYPNPFNPTTTISYSVGERTNVSIKVFDVLGKEVATLVNEIKDAGHYSVNFNASNLSSGIYVYKITAGNFTDSKKMMLMK